jgi:hypothetical protein
MKPNKKLTLGGGAGIWIVNPSIGSQSRCAPIVILNELFLVKLENSTNLTPVRIGSAQLAES